MCLDLDVLDITSAESKATCPEPQDYIWSQYGFKVSVYITQIKHELGLDVGTSFNQPKSEDAKQPQCPPEKEELIVNVVKHFEVIS